MLHSPDAPHVQDGTIPPIAPGAKGRNELFAHIVADDGTEGLGWYAGIASARSVIEDNLKDLLIGQDPFNIEKLWDDMFWRVRGYGRKGIAFQAIAILDIALWDLKAKSLGLPLYRLLGQFADSVPVYATAGWTNYTQDEVLDSFKYFMDRGFTRFKMKVGKDFGKAEREDLARVEAVRRLVGDDAELFVDANWAYTVKQSIRMSRLFEQFDIGFFEEPIIADDIDGMRAIRQATIIPIASGELEYTKYGFKDLIARGGVDIPQPDIGRVGGITEWLKVAHMAHAFNLEITTHSLPILHAHVGMATPNLKLVEYGRVEHTYDFWFKDAPKPENGRLKPFDRPGHGLELDPDVVAKYSVD